MSERIYLYSAGPCVGLVIGFALSEDGVYLASHASSDEAWLRHDMTSEWQHDKYRAHYPNGYVVEWVDDPDTHEGFQAAYALHQQAAREA